MVESRIFFICMLLINTSNYVILRTQTTYIFPTFQFIMDQTTMPSVIFFHEEDSALADPSASLSFVISFPPWQIYKQLMATEMVDQLRKTSVPQKNTTLGLPPLFFFSVKFSSHTTECCSALVFLS